MLILHRCQPLEIFLLRPPLPPPPPSHVPTAIINPLLPPKMSKSLCIFRKCCGKINKFFLKKILTVAFIQEIW